MRCVRLYSDETGESHFEDFEIDLQTVDFAPPAPPVLLSAFTEASQFGFMSCPSGWYGDWHPAPHRQWMLVLSGRIGVEVSDGENREVTAGTVALLEDTFGHGHRTWRIGDEPSLVAVVRIPETARPPCSGSAATADQQSE